MNRPIFIIVNNPLFVAQHLQFLFPHLDTLNIFFVTCSPSSFSFNKSVLNRFIYIPISRDPSFIDLLAFLYFIIIRLFCRPTLVLSFTPKAALINSFTSLAYGKSIHYFTGQRWATFNGLKRIFYQTIDRFVALSCTDYYCDSYSQSRFISSTLNIRPPRVIGSGSVSGIDLSQFTPLYDSSEYQSNSLRHLLYNYIIDESSYVFGYVGRLHSDKGINTLLDAFLSVSHNITDIYLVLVGPLELTGDDLITFKKLLFSNSNLIHIPFVTNTSSFYKSFDVFILPSFREGFGTVILEAAASRLPIITSNIPGPTDFISHMVNGLVFQSGNSSELAFAMNKLYHDKELATKLASAAYQRVKLDFDRTHISNLFIQELLSY